MNGYAYTAVPCEGSWTLYVSDGINHIGVTQVDEMADAHLMVQDFVATLYDLDDGTKIHVTDATLWALHIQGPDDIIPMPTHQMARTRAAELNHAMEIAASKVGPKDFGVRVRAVVVVWDGTPIEHVQEIDRLIQEGEGHWFHPTAPNVAGIDALIEGRPAQRGSHGVPEFPHA